MTTSVAVRDSVRLALALCAIAGLLFLIDTSLRFGFSRLLTKYSVVTNSTAAANQAVLLAPADPEAHRALAANLGKLRLFSYAEAEQDKAVSLRPLDDYLWLELGNIREELDNQETALLSFNEAVRRAPYYAHTHWQRGNLLLRMGRVAEGFDDLRFAARSNRNFTPALIDLAWSLSGRNVKITNELIQVNDDYTRLGFARFLARNGHGAEALAQLKRVGGDISEAVKIDMLRQLLNGKSFTEAFDVWSGIKQTEVARFSIYDGGFESAIGFNDVGFGWVVPRDISGLTVAQDTVFTDTGTRSLRITFAGNPNPQIPVLSQTMLVQPEHRYQISAAVRTKDIITGGLPTIMVTDARSGSMLGKIDIQVQPADEWRRVSFEFSTKPDCDAIVLSLQRNSCTGTPCPIFGVLWLDSASIQELASR